MAPADKPFETITLVERFISSIDEMPSPPPSDIMTSSQTFDAVTSPTSSVTLKSGSAAKKTGLFYFLTIFACIIVNFCL